MIKKPLQTLALLASLALAFLCSSCGGDTHKKVVKDQIDTLNEMTETVENLKDEKKREKAKKKLEELNERFQKIRERQEALGTPDTETVKALEKEYKELSDAQSKFLKAKLNVDIDAAIDVLNEFKSFTK